MIVVDNVCKTYSTRFGPRKILDNVCFRLERGRNIGILGQNGAGKSTLIRLISGAESPTSGRIHRGMSVSWPLAFAGAFQTHLTGLDNLKFVCRIYGVDYKPLIPFVEEFTMAIEFDCFLIDEAMVVGDVRFHEKCHIELFHKRRDRAFILVTHDANVIKLYCERASVLHQGKLFSFNTVDQAYDFYNSGLN